VTQLPADTQARVTRGIKRVHRLAALQSTLFALSQTISELLMKTNTELLQEVADLKQAAIDDQAGDQAAVDRLDKIIADQKAGAIDGDALSAALGEVKAIIVPVTSATP